MAEKFAEWFDGDGWASLILFDPREGGAISGVIAKIVATKGGYDLYKSFANGRDRLIEPAMPDIDMAKRLFEHLRRSNGDAWLHKSHSKASLRPKRAYWVCNY